MDTPHYSKTTVVNRRTYKGFDYIYVGRPTKWGNPFPLEKEQDRQKIIEKYCEYLLENPILIAEASRELRGKKLACWCAPKICHASVLAAVVDGLKWDAYLPINPQLSLFDCK